MTEITKVIEFESMNPFGILRFFDPNFRIDKWLNGNDKNEVITNPD